MGVTRRRFRSAATAISIASLVALAAMAPAPAAAAKPATSPRHIPAARTTSADAATAVIVKFRDGTSAQRHADSRGRAGAARVRALPSIGAEVVRPAHGQSVDQLVTALNGDPAVELAEPDHRIRLASDPALEPLRASLQWGLENAGGQCVGAYTTGTCVSDVDIDATGAWPHATGAGVTVAVLDDGLDFGNSELVDRAWVNPGESGPDGLGGDRETNGVDDDGNGYVDDVHGVNLCAAAGNDAQLHTPGSPGLDWHGSAVASVIAASANADGMAGVAPDAKIMGVRWLVEGKCESTSDAIEAIDYAINQGADVINASWGSDFDDPMLRAAVDDAAAAGVLIVAAAGNSGTDTPFYPAAYDAPNVISVGALDPDGNLASYSNYGPTVDVAAPGSLVLVAYVKGSSAGGYVLADGTSFAAPHVAGIAALVGEVRPDLLANPSALRSRLINSGWKNSRIGSGLTASARVADARYALDVTPPTLGWMTARARAGSTIGSTTASMSLGWAAATDDVGIEYYRVRYRKAGTSTWTTLTSATTSRSATVTLGLGTAYELELLARDRGANSVITVLPVTPTKYEESSTRFTWGGTWGSTTSSSYSGGKARFSGTAGRWAQFAVTGRSVALVAAKGPTRGVANVYVDGAYAATINLYSSSTTYRSVVFATAWSTSGSHTLKVVVKGTSGHPRVDVDAVIVGR